LEIPAQILTRGRQLIDRLLSWTPSLETLFRVQACVSIPLRHERPSLTKPKSGRFGTAASAQPRKATTHDRTDNPAPHPTAPPRRATKLHLTTPRATLV
ncbi:MAG: hypothetical protein AB7U20_03815, partial [Planctomycetaceae bacterium]